MLRTESVYDITVTTHNDYELNYLYLTHPKPADLLEETRMRQEADLGQSRYNALREILPLLCEIPKPGLREQLEADITIAGIKVGTIRVLCRPATVVMSNRGRKRKVAEPAVDIQTLTPEQYKELREMHPEAVGQPTT